MSKKKDILKTPINPIILIALLPLVIFIIFLILRISGVFTIINGPKTTLNFSPSTVPTAPPLPTPKGTENWKIYADTERRFALRYPPEMVKLYIRESHDIITFYEKESSSLFDYNFEVGNTSVLNLITNANYSFDELYKKSNGFVLLQKTGAQGTSKKILSEVINGNRVVCIRYDGSAPSPGGGLTNNITCYIEGKEGYSELSTSAFDSSKLTEYSVNFNKVLQTFVTF